MTIFQPASKGKLIGLTAFAAVITVLFSFLGAPLLRVIQNVSGSTFYWISGLITFGLVTAIGMGPVAFLIVAIWASVGVYGELEKRGRTGFVALAIATFVGTFLSTAAPVLFYRVQGLDVTDALKESLGTVLKQMPTTGGSTSVLSGVEITPDFLISQLPSMMAILVLSSLAFALILDRRVAFMTGLRFERVASHLRLLDFKMPDWMIWVAMFSFLLSFLKLGIPWLSTLSLNLVNVLIAAYFFQGLAILETAFLVYRVGFFVRMVIYIFVVGQLFFLLSLVGLIDFWVDFRRRLKGISSAEKNRKNGEHV